MNFNPSVGIHNCLDLDFDLYSELAKEYLPIGNTNVDDQLLNHPWIYSYFHGILCYMKKLVSRKELELETWESKFKTDLRSSQKLVKLTVEQVKERCGAEPRYFELKEELLALEEIYNLMKSLCSALEHKKDMLVQISANKRMETKLYS